MTTMQRTFRQKLVWPGMVFGLLGISVTLMSITLFLAVSDRSFGVEEDYYAKAVSWDQDVAALAASASLGWNADVTIAPEVDLSGKRSVMVVLTDSLGAPVDAVASPVFAFHHARRNEAATFALALIAPGRYAAGASMARDGLWQLRLRFTRGSDVFLHSLDLSTSADEQADGEPGEH